MRDVSHSTKALAVCAALLAVALIWRSYEPRYSTRPLATVPKKAIDLNSADRDTLLQLPGLGDKSVDAILARRSLVGRFDSVQELDSVPGIGPKTLEAVSPWLTVGPAVRQEEPVEKLERKAAPAVSGGKVDVNRAGVEELATLPGIGPKLAERIIAERKNGLFKTVEDLDRVSGIGPKTIEKLRSAVRFE